MALAKDSDREVISLILLKEQGDMLRTIARARTTRHQKVSLSDVGREIVAYGLEEFFSRTNIGIGANAEPLEKEAA